MRQVIKVWLWFIVCWNISICFRFSVHEHLMVFIWFILYLFSHLILILIYPLTWIFFFLFSLSLLFRYIRAISAFFTDGTTIFTIIRPFQYATQLFLTIFICYYKQLVVQCTHIMFVYVNIGGVDERAVCIHTT